MIEKTYTLCTEIVIINGYTDFSSAEKVDNGPLAEDLTRIEEYKSKGWV